jgi:hypothetical protein
MSARRQRVVETLAFVAGLGPSAAAADSHPDSGRMLKR